MIRSIASRMGSASGTERHHWSGSGCSRLTARSWCISSRLQYLSGSRHLSEANPAVQAATPLGVNIGAACLAVFGITNQPSLQSRVTTSPLIATGYTALPSCRRWRQRRWRSRAAARRAVAGWARRCNMRCNFKRKFQLVRRRTVCHAGVTNRNVSQARGDGRVRRAIINRKKLKLSLFSWRGALIAAELSIFTGHGRIFSLVKLLLRNMWK